MADNLDDEWWLKQEDNSVTDKKAHVKKRKSEDTRDEKPQQVTKSKKQKHDNKKKASQNVKKFERKRITDEPEENLMKPGDSQDFNSVIRNVLKSKLEEAALEDILPNSENDFYPNNANLLEPSDYLSQILPKWKLLVKKSLALKKSGSPAVLIVASSAIRAVELNRQIKHFLDGKGKVAKLFAKHMKVEEQKQFLAKANCQVGIGTPARLLLLIKEGALQLESLVAVVLDWNWRDSKLKRISDIPEVRQDLVTLFKDHILEAVRGSPCKLALL